MKEKYPKEQRHPRHPVNREFKLYSSFVPGTYTVKLTNLSKSGAFIKSKHLPSLGEVISYAMVMEEQHERFMGNARVVWHKVHCSQRERGFGVQFDTELTEELLDQMTR